MVCAGLRRRVRCFLRLPPFSDKLGLPSLSPRACSVETQVAELAGARVLYLPSLSSHLS